MTEHMSYLSNMTCVMRELNMIDNSNNIDVAAMKAEANNKYKVGIGYIIQEKLASIRNCYLSFTYCCLFLKETYRVKLISTVLCGC